MLAERQQVKRRYASTLMLHVPRVDWANVSAGVKCQWRAVGHGDSPPKYGALPRPVVLHSQSAFHTDSQACLAVLEDVRKEPLGAISAEDLAAEGMADLAEFRAYWRARYTIAGYRPLTIVHVYNVRQWRDGDRDFFAHELLEHLYGPWL